MEILKLDDIDYSLQIRSINDEIVSMVKRFAEGMEVNEKTLSLELVNEIGPGGTFITHDHTLDHFREMWAPRIFDRTHFERLGKDHIADAGERAQKRAGEIIKRHKPEPIPESALKDLAKITQKWRSS